MARYDISEEGISKLRQLKSDLQKSVSDIEQSGQTLASTISGLSGELGSYEEGIRELVRQVNREQEPGKESVQQLTQKIDSMIDRIQQLLASRIG